MRHGARARWWSTAFAAAAIAALAVSVVHFSGAHTNRGPLSVPTSARVHDRSAVFDGSGTVHAVRHGGLVCYERVPGGAVLVFPEGYTASFDLRLRDPSGEVVATPGFAVGFAFGDADVRAPSACGSGPARAVVRISGLGD